MKRVIALLLASLMLIGIGTFAASADDELQIIVDGKTLTFPDDSRILMKMGVL
ncbi:MAG: hypothetical protein Q8865_08415 [Bacillota bacterium]|nr:hypothetical protein [Bacillota bacterium]